MMEEKKRRWEEVITFTNMAHNSRKAWKAIRKLSNDPTTSLPPCLVNANQDAHQLRTSNGRGDIPSAPKSPVLPPATYWHTPMVYPFSKDEYRKVMAEQLENIGPKTNPSYSPTSHKSTQLPTIQQRPPF